jgi:hypothetical protein
MIECAIDPFGLVVMDNAFRADLASKLSDILLNATVFASSITCSKSIPEYSNGHYLTENVIDYLTIRRMMETFVLT